MPQIRAPTKKILTSQWQKAIQLLTSVLKMGSGEWGTRGPLWGLGAMGSGEEGKSLFVVRETHGSLAPFSKPFRWALLSQR